MPEPVSLIPRGFSRDIWMVVISRMITAVGFSVSMPYLSLYLHNEKNISMSSVGLILMISSVIGAIAGLYGGELSDRIGRKSVMVRALFWRFLLFILLGYVIMLRGDIYIITGLLILNASFGSIFIPASISYVSDLTAEDRRTSAYGLLRIGGNLGWALGPALGGLLAMFDYSYLFFLTGMCMLIAAVVLMKFSKESLADAGITKNQRAGVKEILSVVNDKKFFYFTAVCLLIFVVWGQLVSPLSVYSVNRIGISKAEVGVLFSINGLMVVLFQFFISNVVPAKRQLNALFLGSIVYAVGYLLVGLAAGFALLIAAIVIITLAEMIVTPTSLSYASIIADQKHKGRYMGFFNLSQSLGWSIAPLLGGILLDNFPGRSLFIWGTIGSGALAAALFYVVFQKAYKETPTRDAG